MRTLGIVPSLNTTGYGVIAARGRRRLRASGPRCKACRISLRGALLIVTLACAALTWRAMCSEQLHRLKNGHRSENLQSAIATLDAASIEVLSEHISLNKIRSLRVYLPSSPVNDELASWGIGRVEFQVQSQPFDLEPTDPAGLVFYKVSVTGFQGKIRPWGITNLRWGGETIATEARVTQGESRPEAR